LVRSVDEAAKTNAVAKAIAAILAIQASEPGSGPEARIADPQAKIKKTMDQYNMSWFLPK